MQKILFILIFLISTISYGKIKPGSWRATLKINDTLDLPFNFHSTGDSIIIRNGDERIYVNDISQDGDSLIIRMPVFDSEFHCKYDGNRMSGYFYNHARKNKNVIPFYAMAGIGFRFSDKPVKTNHNITGRFHIIFDGEDVEAKNAVGVFSQEGNRLTGTILTTTGDHRFLEGEVSGNVLRLSAFDGFHLFLYSAILKGDSIIDGHYFSGQHFHDTWRGRRDENAKLISEDSLTEMALGYSEFNFSFPDENGKMISLSDSQFNGKPVIIQIMGSWCSNCMDETKFLSSWYNEQKEKKIEIIALDYERMTDSITVRKNIARLKKQFNIQYTVLFAGPADKKEAAKTLPMLNRVFAFPTTIFLNKSKKPVKIHTGFNGPATGIEHDKYKAWFSELIDAL